MLHCCFLQICLEEILFAIIDLLFLLLAVQVCRWSSVCLFKEIGFRQNFGVWDTVFQTEVEKPRPATCCGKFIVLLSAEQIVAYIILSDTKSSGDRRVRSSLSILTAIFHVDLG